jgi:hypothetical protein
MKKIFLVALLFGAIFTSCKKTTTDVPLVPFDLSGTTFQGTYTLTGGNTGTGQITISFDANGKAKVDAVPSSIWNKSPNSNTINFYTLDETGSKKIKGTGALNVDNNKITGTLTQLNPATFSYTFSINKQ